MTSKLTREQTQQIIDAADAVITALAGTNDEVHKDDTDKMVRLWDDLNDRYAPPEVVRELARMALAVMDSEPVAVVEPSDYVTAAQLVGEGPARKAVHELYEGALRIGDKLYRHAQQPVVPDEKSMPNPLSMYAVDAVAAIAEVKGWNACRAAMLQAGNSPVIPDGYVMVPAKLTAENGAKSALLGEFNLEYTLTCHECFGEGCEDCNDEGGWINSIPVDWTTIKAIWSKAVEHFVATQQEEKSE